MVLIGVHLHAQCVKVGGVEVFTHILKSPVDFSATGAALVAGGKSAFMFSTLWATCQQEGRNRRLERNCNQLQFHLVLFLIVDLSCSKHRH